MLAIRPAREGDSSAGLMLLVQVNMVCRRGRTDLFCGPTAQYTEQNLRTVFHSPEGVIFVCVDESGAVLGHAF